MTNATVTLTDMETKVLRAFWASEYADGQEHPSIWSFSLTQHSGLPKTSVGGVVSSLVKKGLVRCDDFNDKDTDSYATPTAAGLAAAIAAGLIVSNANGAWKVTENITHTSNSFPAADGSVIEVTTVIRADGNMNVTTRRNGEFVSSWFAVVPSAVAK